MRLDMTVTLGNVIQIGGDGCRGVHGVHRDRERLVRIETQLGPLWSEYERRKGNR
jgi:hypothetical protein